MITWTLSPNFNFLTTVPRVWLPKYHHMITIFQPLSLNVIIRPLSLDYNYPTVITWLWYVDQHRSTTFCWPLFFDYGFPTTTIHYDNLLTIFAQLWSLDHSYSNKFSYRYHFTTLISSNFITVMAYKINIHYQCTPSLIKSMHVVNIHDCY